MFFRKNLTVSKIVAQCRKHPIPYLNTCFTYLNTSTRLSAPYLNTCINYPNTLSQLSAPYLADSAANQDREPSALDNQSESSITSPESSANQKRVLRQPSCHYVTRELSARPEDPSRLSVPLDSL